MATDLATAQGQDTFLFDFIVFAGLSRLRSPSRALIILIGNVEKINVSVLFLPYFKFIFFVKRYEHYDKIGIMKEKKAIRFYERHN